MALGSGTSDDPWQLTTAPGSSSYTMHRDDEADPPLLVCQVGSTRLTYLARAIDDLHAWLQAQGDWVDLGAADEGQPAKAGTVEAFGRAEDNPVGGWYGQRKGYRGRFGMYLPPLLEALGKAELTHEARNNKARAI
ncbi:MAG: DUF6855 family protein [Acidimicrobiales bacterium]